jgi:AbrB family looped-hinge helix DNA binding protein
MKLAQSKLTAQGQISVPAEVRRRLGLVPGSILEWDAEDDKVIIRRVGRYSSEDLHRALRNVSTYLRHSFVGFSEALARSRNFFWISTKASARSARAVARASFRSSSSILRSDALGTAAFGPRFLGASASSSLQH